MSLEQIERCQVCSNPVCDALLLDGCCHAVCRAHISQVRSQAKCQVQLDDKIKCESICTLDEWRTTRLASVASLLVVKTESNQTIESFMQQWLCQVCLQDKEGDNQKINQSISRCIDCDKLLCDYHQEAHQRNKTTKEHSIELIPVANLMNYQGKCPIHFGKQLEMYCSKCDLIICSMCQLKEHSDHTCKPLTDHMVVEMIERLNRELNKVIECIPRIDQMKSSITQLPDDDFQQQLNSIDRNFDELIQQLNEARQRCKQYVEQQQSAAINQMTTYLTDLDRCKLRSTHLESMTNKLKQVGSTGQVKQFDGSHLTCAELISKSAGRLALVSCQLINQKPLIQKKIDDYLKTAQQMVDWSLQAVNYCVNLLKPIGMQPESTKIESTSLISSSSSSSLSSTTPVINQTMSTSERKSILSKVDRFVCRSFGVNGNGHGHLTFPYGCLYDNQTGNLIISEAGNHRIQIVRSDDGSHVRFIGFGKGSASAQMNRPCGIALLYDRIYVCDYHNKRIELFNVSDGQFAGLFDVGASPHCIAIEPEGRLFVTTNDHDVKVFGADGKFVGRIGGGRSSDQNKFNYPSGITFDSQARLIVGDVNNKRISVFDRKFDFIRQFGSFAGDDMNLTIDSFDHIFVSDSKANQIKIFDSNYELLSTYGSFGLNVGKFKGPTGVCFDHSQSQLFVCDYGNHRIQAIRFGVDRLTEIDHSIVSNTKRPFDLVNSQSPFYFEDNPTKKAKWQ